MKILSKEVLSETPESRIIRFKIMSPDIAAKAQAGEFVVVMVSEKGERIPLTIVEADPKAGWITLIVQEAGFSTRLLGKMEPGESLSSLLGPLGEATPIVRYGRVVLVGGGVGIAELYPVARALKAAGNHVTTILGVRTQKLLILEAELRAVSDELFVTTDDGSYQRLGFVSDILKELLAKGNYQFVYAVGPLPMMKVTAGLTQPYGIKTMVSLNAMMVDGTGMCGGCRVTVAGQVRFTCVEGPEFDGHAIDWQELEKKEPRLQITRTAYLQIKEYLMPSAVAAREVEASLRSQDFQEVVATYHEEEALTEARRCLQCKNPACITGCPVGINIKKFIAELAERNYEQAYFTIREKNNFPAICGRVCPAEYQCRKACVFTKKSEPFASPQAIQIHFLERFIGDFGRCEKFDSPGSTEGAAGEFPGCGGRFRTGRIVLCR